MNKVKKKNCVSCKLSAFDRCETLKNNKEYQSIKKDDSLPFSDYMLKSSKFKSGFTCNNYKSFYIECPIEVSKIDTEDAQNSYRSDDIGKFVSVAPCEEEYKGKTFLGIYLGDLPIGHSISHNPETKELKVGYRTNPAMFVLDLNKIVYGCESFWGIIEKPEDLKEITQEDIENVWYVKALKSISEN